MSHVHTRWLETLLTFVTKNPSFVLKEVKKVVIKDRPIPKLTDDHDVLVHVSQTGICGSDVH